MGNFLKFCKSFWIFEIFSKKIKYFQFYHFISIRETEKKTKTNEVRQIIIIFKNSQEKFEFFFWISKIFSKNDQKFFFKYF